MDDDVKGFATRAVHGATVPPVTQQSASPPLYQTSTWRFSTSAHFAAVMADREEGFVYSRGYGNPTVEAFEVLMADLEGTESAFAFASGMAAIHAVVTDLARSGERIVASRELYGGTYSLFATVVPRYGIEVVWVDPHDEAAVAEALPGAQLFYCETISNPVLRVADLSRLARLCEAAGVVSVIDNTFATPYLCNPARLGFDYVIHSATKYIGGHSDLIGGVVCTSGERWRSLRHTAIDTGGTMAPLEAWLCARGLATLALRMDQHCRSALRLAEFLAACHNVEHVHYPGLLTHPSHHIARRELAGFGGMLAFEVAGGSEGGAAFCDGLRTAWIGGSLGGAHPLVAHPASTTHRQLPPEARQAAGIGEGLVRVSVGLEDVDDLMTDFEHALARA
ncbi:MAG: aminotransferase class I/II-fold pyridoxal phosphate-dependent enzyme [Actinomycetota bacterium]|nr:aminotransferase class I/II-fold pyridoxal phosphate-dependent enzyme [Actinomycetota bacterium]MDQ3574077.1 aminotransferase class I/II-fold pyridoxal phosphate-dependent enzyme [Actinomycetota bacterium]